jgi:hypothetical protein
MSQVQVGRLCTLLNLVIISCIDDKLFQFVALLEYKRFG